MNSRLAEQVGDLMREVAREVILPRFERLRRHEIEEKSPGEIVTVVDRLAERLIASRLPVLLPGSRVVGEEQVAVDRTTLDCSSTDLVWLVDPLDGTANFVAGDPRFAVMIALLHAGETVAAWLLDVPSDRLATAERGAGAFIDGRRVRSPQRRPAAAELRGAVLTRYLPVAFKEDIEARLPAIAEALPGMRCAGLEYPAIAVGAQHFALFWRTLPWDHAPGVLFLTEAGGHAARFDGTPYRSDDDRKGLLAAESEAAWQSAHAALLAGWTER